ncbi:MAG: DoxX family protein [Flavobacterium sp.]
MKDLSQLLLRLAIGIGLLSAVADRFGLWGSFGQVGVTWGNWETFIGYTQTLNFNIGQQYANILGGIATFAEIALGILLIAGYKLKYAARFTALLLLVFGLTMCINTKIKYALDYSVFIGSFAALLLSCEPNYKWSIDSLITTKK